eukprot:GHVT01079379.1.p1 GENE.GHVT01079379.1~~GHVT01079379.1.p1  ORF type:complete len:157 (-),score=21.59 GHVT01079379.1:98-568(-)
MGAAIEVVAAGVAMVTAIEVAAAGVQALRLKKASTEFAAWLRWFVVVIRRVFFSVHLPSVDFGARNQRPVAQSLHKVARSPKLLSSGCSRLHFTRAARTRPPQLLQRFGNEPQPDFGLLFVPGRREPRREASDPLGNEIFEHSFDSLGGKEVKYSE